MPCTYDDGGEGERLVREKLQLATALLCGLCRYLTACGRADLIADIAGLTEWWVVHRESDRKREAEERREEEHRKTKESAIAKLTPEERKALGV